MPGNPRIARRSADSCHACEVLPDAGALIPILLAADTAALVLPAHLPGSRAPVIDRHAARFRIARWFLPNADGTGSATEDP